MSSNPSPEFGNISTKFAKLRQKSIHLRYNLNTTELIQLPKLIHKNFEKFVPRFSTINLENKDKSQNVKRSSYSSQNEVNPNFPLSSNDYNSQCLKNKHTSCKNKIYDKTFDFNTFECDKKILLISKFKRIGKENYLIEIFSINKLNKKLY